MPQEGSSTVDKALRLLEVLHAHDRALPLGELARALDAPKASVHRLLVSLRAADLVETDGDGRYALGVGLVRLGLGALAGSPVVHVARRELERAAGELGETFFLVGARAGRLRILERAEGHGMLRAVPSLGTEVPVETTASGRLYLAFAPEQIQRDGAQLPRKLRARVEQARDQGYDVNDGEWIEGLRVIAAPVLASGVLEACVACAGARDSLDGALGKQALKHTREVASRIGQQLSGRKAARRRTA